MSEWENFIFHPNKPTGAPPVRWSDLEEYADNYQYSRSSENLTVLLDKWEAYWQWAWGGDPPPMDYLVYLWERMVKLIEVKEDGKTIRFTDVAAAQAIANKITYCLFSYSLLSGFLIVINAELCFLNREEHILRTVAMDHPDVKRWHNMILQNRLMLAFERFCFKTKISENWEKYLSIPSSFEVIVERVQRLI